MNIQYKYKKLDGSCRQPVSMSDRLHESFPAAPCLHVYHSVNTKPFLFVAILMTALPHSGEENSSCRKEIWTQLKSKPNNVFKYFMGVSLFALLWRQTETGRVCWTVCVCVWRAPKILLGCETGLRCFLHKCKVRVLFTNVTLVLWANWRIRKPTTDDL